MKMIMEEFNLKLEDRNVVLFVRNYSNKLKESVDKNDICFVVVLELEDGIILIGKGFDLMNGIVVVVLNVIKYLVNIFDDMYLILFVILEFIINLKIKILVSRNVLFSC